jgi:gluconate kinase
VRWIYLKGRFDLIRERLEARKGHYMKAGLLESQFATLEEPVDALAFDIDGTPDSIADSVLRRLQESPGYKTGADK